MTLRSEPTAGQAFRKRPRRSPGVPRQAQQSTPGRRPAAGLPDDAPRGKAAISAKRPIEVYRQVLVGAVTDRAHAIERQLALRRQPGNGGGLHVDSPGSATSKIPFRPGSANHLVGRQQGAGSNSRRACRRNPRRIGTTAVQDPVRHKNLAHIQCGIQRTREPRGHDPAEPPPRKQSPSTPGDGAAPHAVRDKCRFLPADGCGRKPADIRGAMPNESGKTRKLVGCSRDDQEHASGKEPLRSERRGAPGPHENYILRRVRDRFRLIFLK